MSGSSCCCCCASAACRVRPCAYVLLAWPVSQIVHMFVLVDGLMIADWFLRALRAPHDSRVSRYDKYMASRRLRACKTNRVEAFSDGVFTIAATFIILSVSNVRSACSRARAPRPPRAHSVAVIIVPCSLSPLCVICKYFIELLRCLPVVCVLHLVMRSSGGRRQYVVHPPPQVARLADPRVCGRVLDGVRLVDHSPRRDERLDARHAGDAAR